MIYGSVFASSDYLATQLVWKEARTHDLNLPRLLFLLKYIFEAVRTCLNRSKGQNNIQIPQINYLVYQRISKLDKIPKLILVT